MSEASGEATSSWPAIGHEDVVWDAHPVSGMTRRDARWRGRTYRAAVVPRIGTLSPLIQPTVLAEAEEAATALARLDADMGARLLPYAAVLLRSEAVSSSQIEGITAGARAIAEAELTGGGGGNAELIVANTHAMVGALRPAGPLTVDRILAMHAALLGSHNATIAGRLRDDQVWIGADLVPHTAEFVAPVAHRVPGALDDLTEFLDRDDLPALVQAAVGHAQFETIHPFSDGNGRTGRALMHATLTAKGLVENSAVPVSAGLLIRRARYIDALSAYRAGDPSPIVSEVSRAVLLATGEGRHLALEAQQVRHVWEERLTGVRADSGARRLADGLIGHPVVNVHLVRTILGVDQNVHRHIDVLVQRGILTAKQDYRSRNTIWRAQDILDVLDAYAARIGRRIR